MSLATSTLTPAASTLDLVVSSVSDAAGRPTNEDAILVATMPRGADPEEAGYVLAVADGMGGLDRGEVASKLAIDLLADFFKSDRPADVALALKQVYRRANEAIYAESQRGGAAGQMGTTLVSAVIHGKYVTIANVGDSRAYLMRANQLTQITMDHSLVNEQVKQGAISAEEARNSPQRNLLTHALGAEPQLDRRMPSIFEITLLPEDRLLLCSDGFYDVMQQQDYLDVLKGGDTIDSARQLSAIAQQRGTTDNVSAIVVAVKPSQATIQRERIGQDMAEQRRSGGLPAMLVPAVILLLVLVAIAVGLYFYI